MQIRQKLPDSPVNVLIDCRLVDPHQQPVPDPREVLVVSSAKHTFLYRADYFA